MFGNLFSNLYDMGKKAKNWIVDKGLGHTVGNILKGVV